MGENPTYWGDKKGMALTPKGEEDSSCKARYLGREWERVAGYLPEPERLYADSV